MSKRRSEDENAAPQKGAPGYIGRRKEHRFEDVGDAKAALDRWSTKATPAARRRSTTAASGAPTAGPS